MQHDLSLGGTKPTRARAIRKYGKLLSLRVKILIGFSVIFGLVFAGAFYWFYTFATEKTLTRLKDDVKATLEGAVKGVNVEELLELYREGQPNAVGFSDDPRYQRQLAWFELVHQIEPRAWLYSYVVGNSNDNRRIGKSKVQPGDLEVIYLVDLWASPNINAESKTEDNPVDNAARFLQSDWVSRETNQVLKTGKLVTREEIYKDRWGQWLSAYAPLKDRAGKVVAILGLDIDAQYVFDVQNEILKRVLISSAITYGILFFLIYVLSGMLTRKLSDLTESAEQIGNGNYGLDLSELTESRFPDEMTTLARVFESMVDSISTREQLIREGKQAEYEMWLALQEERELSELQSRFVSMVSHELRTPLTVIRTSLELLERYSDITSPERKQEYFQRSQAAIHNMNQLLEDVLTIGRAEAGRVEFNPTTFDLKQFCHEIVDEMQLGIGATHRIAFQYHGTCTTVCLDATLLRSILTNLLSNAIKYSKAASVVEFELTCNDTTVTFEVRDYGIGIPKEDQPRLFELFHRARNVSTIRGTGLGLAIVHKCVKHHHGQITFTTEEGVGTTFVVTLPLCCIDAERENRAGLRIE